MSTPKLISAPFTPFNADRSVNLSAIDSYAELLVRNGIHGVFVCGTTGEGVSLTMDERRQVATRWVKAANKRLQVFVHVGHESLAESQALGRHAADIGADAIAGIGPVFYKPQTTDNLVEWCAGIANGARKLPFYYYHIPGMTGLRFSMLDFLKEAGRRIPTLAGIKYSDDDLLDFGLCAQHRHGKYSMILGRDELLLLALAAGASGAVGSTYNFFAPPYLRIISSFAKGDLRSAQADQTRSMRFVQVMTAHGGVPAGKAIMRMIGLDCGPVRLPLRDLSRKQADELKKELDSQEFFEHCSKLA